MSGIYFKGPDFTAPINFVGMYPDGTPMVKTPDYGDIIQHADTIVVRPSNMANFMTAMYLVDSITSKSKFIKKLVLPYIPGARQDRVIEGGDILFTAASVSMEIQMRLFETVVTIDPHSAVMSKTFEGSPFDEHFPTPDFIQYPLEKVAAGMWQGYGGIIAPDAGAATRAETFGRVMNLPVFHGTKVRETSSGRITHYDIDLDAGKHYLVVDDICDGGATFNILGDSIAEQGSYADLYVTHGLFSKGTAELRKRYRNIYTTDSREQRDDTNVSIIPVVNEMENYNG